MITHQKDKFTTWWFSHLAKWKIRKGFRRMSLTRESVIPEFEPGVPIIGVLNHTSWWDALMVLFLGYFVFKKEYFGLFDEEQLKRYGIFRKLGAYSVNRTSPQDVRRFLKYTDEVMSGKSRILWIFAQGDIVHQNNLPLEFQKGFAMIASRFPKVHLLKIVWVYDFWLEPKPEIVMDILPLETLEPAKNTQFVETLTQRVSAEMTGRLQVVQDIVKHRKNERLMSLFTHEAGTNVMYDAYRHVKSWVQGKKFRKSHGVS